MDRPSYSDTDKASSASEPIIIDLSKESSEKTTSSEITPPILEPPEREKTRTVLALAIVLTLPGIVILVFLSLITQRVTAADLKEIGTILLTPLVGIAGAVLGFYFGERRR